MFFCNNGFGVADAFAAFSADRDNFAQFTDGMNLILTHGIPDGFITDGITQTYVHIIPPDCGKE